jgi:plastocyanin
MNARPSPRRFARLFLLLVLGSASAAGVGCELVAEFDRSKIPSEGAEAGDATSRDVVSGDVTPDSPQADAGPDADATLSDAAEAGQEAGNDAADAGDATVSDAAEGGSDASDAGSDADDGGTTMVNGCGETQFAANDFRDAGTPTINFPDDAGNSLYQPACVRIGVNQSVTFMGDFSMHPLHQYPTDVTGSPLPPNGAPLSDAGASVTYQFTQAGTFGYSCSTHEGTGMVGAVDVRP